MALTPSASETEDNARPSDLRGQPSAFHFGFAPNAARARAIDRRMNRELGLSLRYVCQMSDGAISFDETAMHNLVAQLCNGAPVPAITFANYYDLVDAIYRDDANEACRFFAELAVTSSAPLGLQIKALGDDAISLRYREKMAAEQGLDLDFLPPAPAAKAHFAQVLTEALALLDHLIPDLAGEIRAIIRDIVIVQSDPSRSFQFDGGSHFQLWGTLFLNANPDLDAIGMIEILAHESAHALLFGFCIDEPLVENDDTALFASPLRADPRTMDGIFHATFVSARMHWAMSALAGNDVLSPQLRQRARDAARLDLENFDAGYQVVAAHGHLTATGRALMSAAAAYIDNVR